MVTSSIKLCFILVLVSQSYEFDLKYNVTIRSEIEGRSGWECKESNCPYIYTKENNKVHFSCTSDSTQANNLKWKVTKDDQLHNCRQPIRSREIHYIAKLNKLHDGSILYCEGDKGSRSVKLQCTNCDSTDESESFMINCGNPTNPKCTCPIVSYIDGTISSRSTRIKYLMEGQKLDVDCLSADDTIYPLTWNVSEKLKKVIKTRVAKAIHFEATMTQELDNEVIYCSNEKDKSCQIKITFKFKSNMFVKIHNSELEPTYSYGNETVLSFSDNDAIDLECNAKTSHKLKLVWLKDNEVIEKRMDTTKDYRQSRYTLDSLSKADDGSVYKCQLRTRSDVVNKERRIKLQYEYPKATTPVYDDEESASEAESPKGLIASESLYLYLIALLCAIIIIVISLVLYKKYPCKSQKLLDRGGSYKNFENSLTVPPPALENYALPVDRIGQDQYYSYADLRPQAQETYSTPFVPTIQEMYTVPVKKGTMKPECALPSKAVGYANLKTAIKNRAEPGYSNLSEEHGGSSDIYDNGSYSRVK